MVATQSVEVSLDLDFEQGFSEPAPIDALVQRFGRVIDKEIDQLLLFGYLQKLSANVMSMTKFL